MMLFKWRGFLVILKICAFSLLIFLIFVFWLMRNDLNHHGRIKSAQYSLSNGLNVIAISDYRLEKVFLNLSYNTGYVDDPQGKDGLAHFYEHSVFEKINKNLPEDNIGYFQQYQGFGYAFIYYNNTVYSVYGNADQMHKVFEGVAKMFLPPRFEKGDVQRIARTINTEIQKFPNDRFSAEYDPGFCLLTKHKFSGCRITSNNAEMAFGKREAQLIEADLVDFYNKNIQADNIKLVIASPLSLSKIREKAEEYFNKIPSAGSNKKSEPNDFYDFPLGSTYLYPDNVGYYSNVISITSRLPLKGNKIPSPDSLSYLKYYLTHNLSELLGFASIKNKWFDKILSLRLFCDIKNECYVQVQIKLRPDSLEYAGFVSELYFQAMARFVSNAAMPEQTEKYQKTQISIFNKSWQDNISSLLKTLESIDLLESSHKVRLFAGENLPAEEDIKIILNNIIYENSVVIVPSKEAEPVLDPNLYTLLKVERRAITEDEQNQINTVLNKDISDAPRGDSIKTNRWHFLTPLAGNTTPKNLYSQNNIQVWSYCADCVDLLVAHRAPSKADISVALHYPYMQDDNQNIIFMGVALRLVNAAVVNKTMGAKLVKNGDSIRYSNGLTLEAKIERGIIHIGISNFESVVDKRLGVKLLTEYIDELNKPYEQHFKNISDVRYHFSEVIDKLNQKLNDLYALDNTIEAGFNGRIHASQLLEFKNYSDVFFIRGFQEFTNKISNNYTMGVLFSGGFLRSDVNLFLDYLKNNKDQIDYTGNYGVADCKLETLYGKKLDHGAVHKNNLNFLLVSIPFERNDVTSIAKAMLVQYSLSAMLNSEFRLKRNITYASDVTIMPKFCGKNYLNVISVDFLDANAIDARHLVYEYFNAVDFKRLSTYEDNQKFLRELLENLKISSGDFLEKLLRGTDPFLNPLIANEIGKITPDELNEFFKAYYVETAKHVWIQSLGDPVIPPENNRSQK